MPRGPQGQRRPADLIGNAITVGRIATGEIVENLSPPSAKAKAAKAGGVGSGKEAVEAGT
jgi:hypothetical protein